MSSNLTLNTPNRLADLEGMRTGVRRIAPIVAIAVALVACSLPEENFPAQDPDFGEQLEEVNREAERRMEEMMRENEKLLEQFDLGDDPLPVTGFGGG